MSEPAAPTTRVVRASKLQPGDELPGVGVIETVVTVAGKRTMSRVTNIERRNSTTPRTSGWPIEASVVRVHIAGREYPLRFWPRQKVEVLDAS